MAWLVGFFKLFFPRLFGWLGKFTVAFFSPLVVPVVAGITKLLSRKGEVLIMLGVVGGFVMGFTAALNAIGASIMRAAPGDFIVIGQMLLPGNTSMCISILVAAKAYQVLLIWKVRIAELMANS